ncbi:MAG: hypothetical protein A3G38_01630 [Omnitrophica WOR_2 bacterium RIFCSPLOWO2_12_FULL_51_8]|nr:MAG: hypothetical protein A3G38_01630 [Omnitrophica WOR_2 bacterium RIFCSPLOWO2_12_FULL_51_8]
MWLKGFFRRRKRPPISQEKIERRQLPRWQLGCEASAKWQGQDDFVSCAIKDMNFRGFQIWLDRELCPGCCALIIRFGTDLVFNIEVCVVWHALVNAKHVYGCRFIRLRDADKERLYHFVFQNFPGATRL